MSIVSPEFPSVTVTAADNRTAAANNAASVTVVDPGPTITANEPDSPDGFYGAGPIQFAATANEPWDPNAQFTAEWVESWGTGPGPEIGDPTTGTGTLAASASIDSETLGVMQFDHGGLLVTDGNGAYSFLPVTSWLMFQSAPQQPTVSITETDPNGMVFEGDAANFKIAVQFAAGTPWQTAATIYYQTVDGTAAGGTDYVSTDGPHYVTVYSPDGGGEVDATFTVSTTGGIDGGGDKTFSVKLLTPSTTGSGLVVQSGTNASATATIVRPEVDISSPDEPAGALEVPDDGSRAELDLQVTVNAALASQGGCCAVLANVSGLQFWDSQTGGSQITPDENGDIVDASLAGSGEYSGTLWVCADLGAYGRRESGRWRSGATTVNFQAEDSKGQHVHATVNSATFQADVKVYLANSFTDTDGVKHVAATSSPNAGAPTQYVVLSATNLQDSADQQGVMSHCCWVQFFNFSAVRTDSSPRKPDIQNSLAFSIPSPDRTTNYTSTVNPGTPGATTSWYLDNGGTDPNANYEWKGLACKGKNSLAIADAPGVAAGSEAIRLVGALYLAPNGPATRSPGLRSLSISSPS